ncbi:glycosyl hydrolase family protein [Hymenobacter aquaticus]|uniref:Glycosyl hydrolase family protein n=1 Tax=Hymenobacter aquaticus TaxID=1867101 RepID=A0A4Z0PXC9_9BACT|nr:Ig-like domain-containing protein [Hymenobacter aquaticus]TGE21591.1 glycosyl hydrolase family protein [Hymenobacter aquaticus]
MKNLRAYPLNVGRAGGRWLLLLLLACLGPRAASAQTLVWEENFDGSNINPDTWTFDFGDGCERALCGWGNQELQYYTSRPENARLDNGNLRIEARREAFQGKAFTSARLKTLGRMHFKYGTLEARIKVSNLQNGLWPAFWMLGATGQWPASGEIDMMEMGSAASYPANVNNWAGAALHWENNDKHEFVTQLHQSATPLTDAYHVYKLQWTATEIKVFIDNVQYFSQNITAADMEEFHRPQFVLLNLAVGGIYTGKMGVGDITAPLPSAMLVDYLRLYQNPGDELYLGKNNAFAGDYGVLSERASITNKLAFDGQDASLYYWNNLTNITTPPPVPFEGQNVLAVHANAGDWFGMGIDNAPKNLGNFATGALKFQFKTTYAGQFKIGVKSGHGESWINFPAGGPAQYGLVRDGSWHEVTIPLSTFNQPNMGMNIDLLSMNGLFMFAGDPAAGPADFFFDDMRYTGGVAANPAPTVSLTAPAPDAIVALPASLTLTATAADANGSVAKVEFFQGTTKLGEDLTAPYSYTWASVPAGVYSLTARATDDEGTATTSSPVTVYVTAAGNTAPTVALTAPTANARFLTPASITLSADAADTGGGIYKVEFFQGTTLLATDFTAPYSFTWSGAAVGSYAVSARATDTGGLTATSAAVSITVADPIVPTVSITAPTSGTTLTAPADVTIAATAATTNGTIAKVEFFQGSTKLGEDLTAPYTYAWTGVAPGTYSLTAKATAADGYATTSAPVALTVRAIPCSNLAANGEYRYEVFTSGGNVTYTFFPLGATAGGNLALIFIREGTIGAYPGYTMVKNADGSFSFTKPIASGVVTSFYFTYQYGAGGPEHNTAATPHSYTVGTLCTGGGANNLPPTVSLTSPTAADSFVAPAAISLAATAADADGTIAKVEFFQGSTKLAEDLSAPYTYAWTGVATGAYELTAVATDNSGTSTTSAAVTVLVRSTDGSCATTADYSFRAVTVGANVTYTFHPLGAVAGGNLALIYIREGSNGAYPGYPMVKNAVGDFTFTKAIASGIVTSVYFTYQAGPNGPEKNTAATPHTYLVGSSCGVTTSTASAAATAAATLHPNPLGQGAAVLTFPVAQASPYTVALYDLKGARLATVASGQATAGQLVSVPVPAETLANGIYLVQVTTGSTVLTKRLVISR